MTAQDALKRYFSSNEISNFIINKELAQSCRIQATTSRGLIPAEGIPTTGEKIRALRARAGLTQQQLGIACGLKNQFSAAERGRVGGERPIPRKRLKAAAEALQVEISELI